jgi:hypothetical protein
MHPELVVLSNSLAMDVAMLDVRHERPYSTLN